MTEHEPAEAHGFSLASRQDVVVDVLRTGGRIRVVLAGELDFHTVDEVRTVLENECARRPEELGIDLAAVEFVDSHALRLFVEAHRRLEKQGCSLALIRPSERVQRLLALTRLDQLLPIESAPPASV